MRILWITNIPLPPICRELGWPIPAVGGWMYSSLKRLNAYDKSLIMAVATVYEGNEIIEKQIDGITYYLLPIEGKCKTQYNIGLEKYWRQVADGFKPDAVHIHGSEFPYGLAYVNAVGVQGVVVSLQGIISGIARYYASGINFRNVKNCLTPRDIIKHGGILNEQREFEQRGKLEIVLLSKVNHIIGRTKWDKAHAWAINPKAIYHYCGETLRDTFYQSKWGYQNCEPHSIFVSQASCPIKGLHMLLEAMPLILRHYPDAKIISTGNDPTKPWWRITQYGKYLKQQISRLNLKSHIQYVGMLTEEEMCKAYLKANVFVCPSSIENSPNSLGEAQLLGMPYIASYVGGIPEIVDNNPDVLYRFEETEMLANKICNIFSMKEFVKSSSADLTRYDADKNLSDLVNIYYDIINTKNS